MSELAEDISPIGHSHAEYVEERKLRDSEYAAAWNDRHHPSGSPFVDLCYCSCGYAIWNTKTGTHTYLNEEVK